MNTSLPRLAHAGAIAALLATMSTSAALASGPTGGARIDTRESPSIMQREALAHDSLPSSAVPAPITVTPRATPSRSASGAAAPRALTSSGGSLSREVFGFAPYWAVTSAATLSGGDLSDLQYDKLSTVAYFGLTLTSSGTIASGPGLDAWNSSQLNTLVANAHSNGDRVVVTAICFNNADINSIVSNAAAGQQAINSIIGAVQQRGLDGVDIDFEGTTTNYPNIQQGFTNWVHQLSTQLRQQVPGALLTVDAYSGSASWSGGFMRIDALAPYVDDFFVMAYDMGLSNAQGGQPDTLPNAPLGGPYTYTDSTSVDQFIQKTTDPSKVILGVPYYGYKYSTSGTGFNAPVQATSGCYDACADPYDSILADFACAPQLQRNWDTPSSTPWASWYSPATNDPCGADHGSYRELYYDDANSLGAKYDLVNNRSIRGSGIWALGYDHGSTDLWNEIAVKYHNQCTGAASALTTMHSNAQVAVVGLDCALWVRQSSAGFTPLGGILLAAPAVVPTSTSTDPYYIVTGRDSDLWIRTASAGWQKLNSNPVTCIDNPAAVTAAGRLWVGCQGADHALWGASTPIPASGLPVVPRQNWTSYGGVLGRGPAVAVVAGVPTFFVVGSTGAVLWQTATGGGYNSTPWLCDGHPAVASSGTTAYFACNGRDHTLWYATNPGKGWSAATSLGGILIDGPGIAASPSGPRFYVEGQDTAVWERTIATGWVSDGGLVRAGAGAAWIS